MAKMTLGADHFGAMKHAAKDRVNATFARQWQSVGYRLLVHARKREIAATVKAGAAAPEPFAEEAALRGMTCREFADLVLSKSAGASVDHAETHRQRVLLMIEAATSPEEVRRAEALFGTF
jgi:hypothetical protein